MFAGRALDECPNLRADSLRGIYEDRPLVCRIYPMEVNLFIPLYTSNRACPPQAWESDRMLCSDEGVELTVAFVVPLGPNLFEECFGTSVVVLCQNESASSACSSVS